LFELILSWKGGNAFTLIITKQWLIFFQHPNDFGIRAWTSDSITGTVLALLMNGETMVSVLYIA